TTHRSENSSMRAASDAELERLWHRLQPLVIDRMPLAESPPRGTRFGSSLVLIRVHWVRPEMVVEVTYAEWTPDGLLRHVVGIVSLTSGEQNESTASCAITRLQPHAAIGSPPRLGRSAASSARRDGVAS